MNALILVREKDGRQAVSGRDLHAFLGLGRDYTNWFKSMVEYGFIDGQDFTPVRAESTGGRPGIDHALTLDMAKELAMIQRTSKGKEARQYFIEVERQSRQVPALPRTYAEALRELADTAERTVALEAKAAEDAPKVLFADAVATSEDSILVARLAVILKQNGVDIGEVRLFRTLREDGYLCRAPGADWNRPTQRSMDLGLFEVVERTVQGSDGSPRLKFTPKVTGKGQTYFINRYATGAAA